MRPGCRLANLLWTMAVVTPFPVVIAKAQAIAETMAFVAYAISAAGELHPE